MPYLKLIQTHLESKGLEIKNINFTLIVDLNEANLKILKDVEIKNNLTTHSLGINYLISKLKLNQEILIEPSHYRANKKGNCVVRFPTSVTISKLS